MNLVSESLSLDDYEQAGCRPEPELGHGIFTYYLHPVMEGEMEGALPLVKVR